MIDGQDYSLAIKRLQNFFADKDRGVLKNARVPDGPYMIRGIAGSGKTISLCRRAVHAHLKHPEWTIAFVFFTRSLYGYVNRTVEEGCEAAGVKWLPGNQSLQVIHAWGGNSQGLYANICREMRISPMNVEDVRQEYNGNSVNGLGYASNKLLADHEIPRMYDLLLIDEGQDLMVSDKSLLFEGKQPIYWMAYSALRPVNIENPEVRRMVWAFDEYQNISSQSVPKSIELFGREEKYRTLMRNRVRAWKVCYRNPAPIIMTAHTLGMGLLNREGQISGPTNQKDWKALGYDIRGSFRIGQQLSITRPLENSPNPVVTFWRGPLVSIRDGFESRADENKWIAGEISNLIRNKGLRAEDIMVVSLKGEMDEALNLFRDIRARDIDAYLETTSAKNLEDINANRDKFGDAGAVSVSRVARAKGNEANFVFVAHLDAVASDSESLKKRNLLLTAVTRSRGWLRFSGTGYYGFYDEVKETVSAINNSMEITFVFKRFPRWSFNTVSEEEEETGIVQTKLDEDL